ncbi:MAG TPA: SRPBCC family protein [Mycobacterium sp.]
MRFRTAQASAASPQQIYDLLLDIDSSRRRKNVRFQIVQESAASPQQIYDVLLDVERWPEWMDGVRRAGWEKRGAPGTGVGGVRRFSGHGRFIRERILAGQSPGHHVYTMLSGAPVKNYRGEVDIDYRSGGSLITWNVSFDSRIPLLGSLIRRIVKSTITKGASDLAVEAERRAGRGKLPW